MGHQDGFAEFSSLFWEKVHGFDINLTGTYPEISVSGRSSAEEVALALKFWRGIRAVRAEIESGEAEDSVCLFKEELLHAHRFDERPLIALVATVELLPTKVWRRALWHYNIDFQSFESFLRRITPEQVEGLQVSLDAILYDQAPPCFCKGWKNVLRRIFKLSWASPWRLRMESPEDRERRYESKGAFAYEFFGIDFGHVLYRHEKDDREIDGNLATRFLSRKHDRNDFVVNQEDGAYWEMYRIPRSNYIWFPNRDVQLKQAICPGFWYTFFVWLLVLFISPLAGILTGIEYAQHASLWVVGLTGIVGVVTPFIISAVIVKYTFIQTGRFIVWMAKQTGITVDEEYWSSVGMTFVVIAAGSMGGICVYGVWLLMYPWFYESAVLATYMTAFLFLYAVHVFENMAESSLRSVILPILSLPTTLFVLGKVLFDAREALRDALRAVALFFIEHWQYIAVSIAVLAIVVVLFMFLFLLSKWEKRAWRGDKKAATMVARLAFVGKIAVCILALASIGVYGYIAVLVVSTKTVSTVLVGIVLAVIFWALYATIDGYQPEYIDKMQAVLQDAPYTLRKTDWEVLRSIFKNEWIRSQRDSQQKAWWLLGFIQKHFSVEKFPNELLGIDAKGFGVANAYHLFLLEHAYRLDFERRAEYVKCMLQGIPLCEAEKMIEAWRVRARESAAKWKRLYEVTIGRFIVRPFLFIVAGIWKLICDARTMWQILNESCPYWMRPERLDQTDH